MFERVCDSIFAVSLNWNGFSVTVPCIDSLKKSTVPFTKIIVIDQASPDGSGKKLQNLYSNDEQVHIIQNKKNFGFATGTNIGIRYALDRGAEFVFIINNDTIVKSDCIELLLEALESNPSAGTAGPAIMYYSNPEKIWQSGGYFNKLKMGTSVPAKGIESNKLEKSVSSVGYLTGCALLFPTETFKKVGFFDETYFLYSEDVDLGLRIQRSGLKLLFVPRARVWHKIENINVDRTTPVVMYNLARSSVIMIRKNFSGIERLYGLTLRFTIYTIFRFWQIMKGRSGWNSFAAWLKGLLSGLFLKIDK